MNNNSQSKNFYLILILGLLTAIGPLSIDMYLPAFPDIAKGLNTTVAQVMISLSSFLIGISSGHFIYVFAMLIIVGLIILTCVYFLLPESRKPDPNFSLRPRPIVKNFTGIIKHPQFYTYVLTGAISYAGLSAYVSGSPYVFMEIFRVS